VTRRALVTGSAGHIGGLVVRELLEAGWEVRGLDVAPHAGTRRPWFDHEAFTALTADVREAPAVRDAADGCEAIVHSAMLLWTGAEDPDEVRSVGHDGLSAVLSAARTHDCAFVHTSSAAAVGEVPLGSAPADESRWNARPITPYTRTKTEVERRLWAERQDLRAVAVLPTMTVGPHDPGPTPSNARILGMLRRPASPVWFDGGLDVVDARDVARGHVLALERGRPGERYLLTGTRLTMRELLVAVRRSRGLSGAPRIRLPGRALVAAVTAAEGLAGLAGRRPPVTAAQLRHRLRLAAWQDGSRARAELGHRPRPLAETLSDLAAEAGWDSRPAGALP